MNHLLQTSLKAGRGKGREAVPFLEVTADHLHAASDPASDESYLLSERAGGAAESLLRRTGFSQDPGESGLTYRRVPEASGMDRRRQIPDNSDTFYEKRTVSKLKKRIKRCLDHETNRFERNAAD